VTPAERADDVAEVVRIMHFADGKDSKTSDSRSSIVMPDDASLLR
jgi:hypothetical protein